MDIKKDLCIGCGQCVIVCPVQAIKINDNKAEINQDLCVECSICYRNAECPVKAIRTTRLKWPRIIRNPFSDVISTHKLTGVPGRGTEEMKTNDVTNRYLIDEIGFSIEIGRPGLATKLKNVNIFTNRLTKLDVEYEPASPVTALLTEDQHQIKKKIENERVLSAIIEFKVKYDKVPEVLSIIKEVEREIDTVFTVGVVSRFEKDGTVPIIDLLNQEGFDVNPNAKINVGLGKI